MTEHEDDETDEKTDADVSGARREEWEGDDRTEVDAHPPGGGHPGDTHPELRPPR